ncbi:uncharacterized protein AMSG_06784 [Thecamonas trahens ATCC 50062]|uniref:Uncharacterized protein n=1 Tax=Thecamonas trahens ATCC 50062 TaxID=461836 RepID=A0A0L0DG29_THETB|nr:hypothetical protein AMSG_06784 [Thecamonas trahens ATCC 50062]KNC50303.1 hypothetical protein AMSG_06784 [Thecamonas trahens ATCC 50062]|eukprot:XP_013756850.1 hypothetical protein AMSG_06784 [Thecamonas trahens ATCC 50062]
MKARALDNRLKLQQDELQRRLDRLRSELEARHSVLAHSVSPSDRQYSESLRRTVLHDNAAGSRAASGVCGSADGSGESAMEARNEMLRAEIKMLRSLLESVDGDAGSGGVPEEARRKIGKYAVYIQKLQHKLQRRKVEVRELRASESRLVVKLQDLESALDDERERSAKLVAKMKAKRKDRKSRRGTAAAVLADEGVGGESSGASESGSVPRMPSNPLFESMASGSDAADSPVPMRGGRPASGKASRPVSMAVSTLADMAELERQISSLQTENEALKVKLDANATYLRVRKATKVEDMSEAELRAEVGALREEVEASHLLVARHMDSAKVTRAALANAEAKIKKVEASSRGKVLRDIEQSLQDARLHNKQLRDRVHVLQTMLDANMINATPFETGSATLMPTGIAAGAALNSSFNTSLTTGPAPEQIIELEAELPCQKVRAFEISTSLDDAEFVGSTGSLASSKDRSASPHAQLKMLRVELNAANVMVTQQLAEISILFHLEAELKDAEKHTKVLRQELAERSEEAASAQSRVAALEDEVVGLRTRLSRSSRRKLRRSFNAVTASAALAHGAPSTDPGVEPVSDPVADAAASADPTAGTPSPSASRADLAPPTVGSE